MDLKGRLDPAHLRSPRMRSLLRYVLVAGLLTLAAGTLLVDPSRPAGCDNDSTGADPPVRAVATATPEVSDPSPDTSVRPAAAGTDHASPKSGPFPPDHAALPLPSGTVGVPVQLAEPGTASVVRPGDRVDLVARTGVPHDPASEGNVVLTRDVLVISVTPEDGLLYLAMTPREAGQVSRLAPGVALGVTVHSE